MMLQLRRVLRSSMRLALTASPHTYSSSLVEAAHARDPREENAKRPSSRDSPVDPAARSRVYIIGRRKEQEEDISEALRALRAYSMETTPETVEVKVGVNMKLKKDKMRNPFKGSVVLPHTFGEERIVLFVLEVSRVQMSEAYKGLDTVSSMSGKGTGTLNYHHDTALEAGADIVAGEEIFPELEEDSVHFDVCLTTPTLLDRFKPLQKILKSKMPNVRRGTVVSEEAITEAVQEFKTKRQFESDSHGNIPMPVGMLDFHDEHIVNNISCLLKGVITHRGHLPATSFIRRVLLTSTYGPDFAIRTRELL